MRLRPLPQTRRARALLVRANPFLNKLTSVHIALVAFLLFELFEVSLGGFF